MDVEFAFPADAAIVSPDRKLSALGAGFEDVTFQAFPGTLAALAFVAKIRIHPSECGRQHMLEIELWDQNGVRIGQQMHGQFAAERHPTDPARPVSFQIVLNFQQLVIPSPGTYDFHVVVDGTHLKAVSIYCQLPAQQVGELPSGETP